MATDLLATDPQTAGPGFGVYVHWPFCLSKCPYCDFNSHVRHEKVDEARFVRAFEAEIAHRAALAPGRTVDSVFFGGGTPSLMRPETVGAILDAVARRWRLADGAEVTLEANPTSVEAGRFRDYRAAGVNRVSIGVQALDDADLQALGRRHSVAEALAALDTARAIFTRFSFDLIYARSGQSLSAWRGELSRALGLAGGHLSLYQLTIEPGTMFEKLRDAGRLDLPSIELSRDFWDATQELMSAAGMPAYEVSNHARPGAESRHNLVYWRAGDYAGVGPGAHGRLSLGAGRRAQACARTPEAWLEQVEREGHGLVEDAPLTREEQGDEFLLMGLRLAEGVDPARFEAASGRALDPRRVDSLVAEGMVERTRDGRLRVSAEGFPLLDAVVADLAA
ncbi:radical SAM family heme chaperone HemW [Methylocella sp.]|uniref:radical SAM family heme chaperone HemW n=1 Tax=Methylocella sp. TaxID=1978226 RepID=UPI003785095B